MSQRQIEVWASAVLQGRREDAVRAFHGLLTSESSLAAARRFCQIRALNGTPALVEALQEYLAVTPVQDDAQAGKWRVAKTIAFSVVLDSSYAEHLEGVERLWVERLRLGGVHVGAAGGQEMEGFTEHVAVLAGLRGPENMHLVSSAPGWHYGPPGLDKYLAMGTFGASIQTLWVSAPGEPGDLSAVAREVGRPSDPSFMAAVRGRLMSAWAEAVEDYAKTSVLEETPSSDGHYEPRLQPDEVDSFRKSLAGFRLEDPLDVRAGWQRQQVQGFLNAFITEAARVETYSSRVIALQPMVDGQVLGVMWERLPLPTPESAAQVLWPASRTTPGHEAMGLSTAESVLPDAIKAVWPAVADDRGANSEVGSDVIEHARSMQVLQCRWSPEVLQSCKRWLEVQPQAYLVWVDAETASAREVAVPPSEAFEAVSDNSGSRWREAGTGSAGVRVTAEQALFGTAGATLVAAVASWPKEVHEHFRKNRGYASEDAGPALALRMGLGTWVQEAFTSHGRELVRQLIAEESPLVFNAPEQIGPALMRRPTSDAAALGAWMASQPCKALCEADFAWALGFVLGGAEHALVEVRPALQEQLVQTDISEDVQAWTLRGPTPLTYVDFPVPLELSRRERWGRADEDRVSLLVGAYIWSRESGTGLDLAVGLNLRGVSVDKGAPAPAPKLSERLTLDEFQAHLWKDIDPEQPLSDLVARLADELAQHHEPDKVLDQEDRENAHIFMAALKIVALVLLYMGLRDARLERDEKEYSSNAGRDTNKVLRSRNEVKKSSGPTSSSVLRRIWVGPESFVDEADELQTTAPGRTVSAHWRRGHFRMQAHGPGRRDRRQVWIRPVLVAGSSLTMPPARLYIVT